MRFLERTPTRILSAGALICGAYAATQSAHAQGVEAEDCSTLPITCSIAKNDSLAFPINSGGIPTYSIRVASGCGDEWNVWLTSPVDGWIRNVQILWSDGIPGNTDNPTVEEWISIHDPGVFPNKGPLKDRSATDTQDAIILAPLLSDEALNIFPYYDESSTQSLRIPVAAGETFVVSVRMAVDHTGDPLPGCSFESESTMAQDYPGTGPSTCQAGRNGIEGPGLPAMSYCDFDPFDLTGDLIIRALIEEDLGGPDPEGACCLTSGCQLLTEADCLAQGGVYGGDLTSCATSCSDPVGSCCFSDGSCQNLFEADCLSAGGTWNAGVACAEVNCPSDTDGACCLTFGCAVDSLENCLAAAGLFIGIGTDCGTVDCENPPAVGSCCLPDESCLQLTQQTCTDLSGTWNGAGTNCGTTNCSSSNTGACCIPSTGGCLELDEASCDIVGGVYKGNGTTCATAGCDEGACCFGTQGCLQLTEADCATAGGTFLGLGTDCAQGCTPPCPSDTNGDNVVDVIDLLQVLGDWGGCAGCPGDVANNDDIVDVQDLLQVLGDWGPCS